MITTSSNINKANDTCISWLVTGTQRGGVLKSADGISNLRLCACSKA